MKKLHSLRYRDLRHLSTAEVLEGRPSAGHTHKFTIIKKEPFSVTLQCYCADRLTIKDPVYYATHEANTFTERTPEPHRFDSVDRKHIKKGIESYEGNLHDDLLQPYDQNGQLNPEFVKKYGVPNAIPSRDGS
jgi:hypothetical protein